MSTTDTPSGADEQLHDEPPMTRAEAVRILLEFEDDLGKVPSAIVREASSELAIAERTVWRWLRKARSGGDRDADRRIDWEPDTEFLEVYAAQRGNLSATLRDLHRAGVRTPTYATVRRRLQEYDQAVLSGLTGGLRAFRSRQVYRTREVPHRNHTWELDHTEAPVWVLHPTSGRMIKPWITVVEDAATRFVLSLVVTYHRPSSNEIVAAIASAMLLRPLDDEGHVGGGKPLRCQWDQGADFLSDHVKSMMTNLGIDARPVAAYSPHQNGKVEAFNKIMKNELLCTLPGFSKGPKFGRDKPFLTGDRSQPLQLLNADQFEELLTEWLESYNHEREHGQIGNRTPAEAWLADDYELAFVEPEELWPAMLAVDTRKVGPKGIQLRNRFYQCAELARRGGHRVQVRYLPNHPDFIEVFDENGRHHIATAFETLNDEQWQDISALRREQFAEVKRVLLGSVERRLNRAFDRPADGTFSSSRRVNAHDELMALDDAANGELPSTTYVGRDEPSADGTTGDDSDDLLDLETA